MYLGVEEEHVEYVRYRRRTGEGATRSRIGDAADAGDSAELAGAQGAEGVAGSGGKEVEADLGQSGAVDLREFDFKKNFFGADGAEGQHVDDVLGIGGSERAGVLGNLFGSDVTGKNDGGTRRGYVDLLAGEKAMNFLGSGGDIDIDAKIEAARAFCLVPDEEGDFTRRESVDQDLRRRHDKRVGNSGIGDRDAL